MRDITEIIVHCTATPFQKNITAEDIRRFHIVGNGWDDIGYHFIICLDGTIETGRPISKEGAHCKGHNRKSIGVAYVGGLDRNNRPADTRTSAQKTSLVRLLKSLKKDFPEATLHPHNEFAPKACPCFNVKEEYGNL